VYVWPLISTIAVPGFAIAAACAALTPAAKAAEVSIGAIPPPPKIRSSAPVMESPGDTPTSPARIEVPPTIVTVVPA
jgi:hypothetical protein